MSCCSVCFPYFLWVLERILWVLESIFGAIGHGVTYLYARFKWQMLSIQVLVTFVVAAISYLNINEPNQENVYGFCVMFAIYVVAIIAAYVTNLRNRYNTCITKYPTLNHMNKSVGIVGVLRGFVQLSNIVGSKITAASSSFYTVSFYVSGYIHVVSLLKLYGFSDVYSTTDGLMSINITVFVSLEHVGWKECLGFYAVNCVLMMFKMSKLELAQPDESLLPIPTHSPDRSSGRLVVPTNFLTRFLIRSPVQPSEENRPLVHSE